MHSLRSNLDSRSTVLRLRRKRREVVRRRRRNRMLGGSAAFALAVSTALAVANFTGTDLAGAAVSRAASIADLMDGRSPGARTEAQLTKTKAHRVLAERVPAPPVTVPHNLAEVIAPPIAEIVPIDLPKAPAMLFAAPALPPGAVFFSPPGGGGGGLPGGGGGGPGGGGGSPPGSPPSSPPLVGPPAVPEPGTWVTMLMGFAFVGWSLRRQRKPMAARVIA